MMRKNMQKNLIKGNSRKVRHSKDDAISEKELIQLIKGTDEWFDKVVIILAGFEGMRGSEIAHMEKTWIDFQKEIIKIPPEKKCNCRECILRKRRIAKEEGQSDSQIAKINTGIWIPKTPKSIRSIPLRYDVPIVKETIETYFGYYRKIGCSRQTIYNHIIDVAKSVGVTKKIYPHSLRATSASLWGLMGVSAGTLCSIMGWENIETANYYVTADEESALQEAKWKMGNSGGRY